MKSKTNEFSLMLSEHARRLEAIEKKLDDNHGAINAKLDDFIKEVLPALGGLKVKASIFGVVGGAITTIGAILVNALKP